MSKICNQHNYTFFKYIIFWYIKMRNDCASKSFSTLNKQTAKYTMPLPLSVTSAVVFLCVSIWRKNTYTKYYFWALEFSWQILHDFMSLISLLLRISHCFSFMHYLYKTKTLTFATSTILFHPFQSFNSRFFTYYSRPEDIQWDL